MYSNFLKVFVVSLSVFIGAIAISPPNLEKHGLFNNVLAEPINDLVVEPELNNHRRTTADNANEMSVEGINSAAIKKEASSDDFENDHAKKRAEFHEQRMTDTETVLDATASVKERVQAATNVALDGFNEVKEAVQDQYAKYI